MRARTAWTASVALALAALAVWRAVCLRAGPDIDTDAYAHHMIARAILADPRDLAVHWVWLPLFHYAQVPLVVLGGTIETVRWINLALSAALPAVLFAYVRRTTRAGEGAVPRDAVALFAALVTGACPIAMQMGTTAQPEPLFALVLLGVAIGFQRGRSGWTAVLLAGAVLLRYEAWASLVVVGAWRLVDVVGPGREPRGRRAADLRAWAVVALPCALLAGWAALRRPVDGQWFGFLRQTHEFASDALQERGLLGRGLGPLLGDLLYYPVFVAARVLGPVVALVPFGIARTVRQQGARFVAVLAACLGFVSLSWVTRGSLGLDRHFVVVVPLYATFAAQGVAAAGDAGARIAHRFGRDSGLWARAGVGLAATLGALLLVGLGIQLTVWMGFWRASIARGWPEREALGAYLRSLPESETIFCDDATLEIRSGLDRRRFDRHWVDDPHTWDLIAEVARARGDVFVATWRRKLRGHEGAGEIVFASGGDPVDPGGTGVAVMRVPGEGARSQR
jgi:hypothetical protein